MITVGCMVVASWLLGCELVNIIVHLVAKALIGGCYYNPVGCYEQLSM